MKHLIVGCLPRSCSAYLVALLNTQPGVLALHNGVGRFGTEGFFNIETEKAVISVGQDVLIPEVLSELRDKPVHRWYWLYRELADVEQSLARLGIKQTAEHLFNQHNHYHDCVWPKPLMDGPLDAAITLLYDVEADIDWLKLREVKNMRVTNKRYESCQTS